MGSSYIVMLLIAMVFLTMFTDSANLISSFCYRLMFSKQIWKAQNGKFWKILFWKMSSSKLDSSSLRSISTGPGLRSVAVTAVLCILLKELELQDFRLFHSYKDLSKPQLFLKKDIFNASSCYTLGWVNTRWK